MSPQQVYENFLTKLNRNDSNTNINVPRGRFVLIYNEQRLKWLKDKLRRKLSSDDIDELRELLVDNAELRYENKNTNYVEFSLPEDFFHFSSSYSIASKGGCSEKILDNWNTKGVDIRILLRDHNNKPSFEYEETLIGFSNKKVKVYFDGFKILKAYLTYYKVPKEIDIAGSINSKNQPSKDIDPELSDFNINEIISRCVLEVTRNVSDTENFQLSQTRIAEE